jgi:hypothetical protein
MFIYLIDDGPLGGQSFGTSDRQMRGALLEIDVVDVSPHQPSASGFSYRVETEAADCVPGLLRFSRSG